MKVIKPAFIHHDNKPIFSCDIHPDGLRFATGGQGQYSGRIAIWNLRAVIDEAVEHDENVPKLLCHLDNHLSCVNSVRWSHSGKSLASGGDDKLIMIWARSGEARLNADGVLVGLEQWRCAHTLSGHDSDVLDVAWAPLDTKLATCSVDNTVIVWSMDGKPSVLTRLTGHGGLVKGVAWDPVGEFLASQSDDRSLRLWRTSNWTQQAAITDPFKDCGDMTHVLRLHWSPDGQYVVSAHASNCGGPTAQIIERPMDAEKLAWACDMDFVGHRKAVTCVKFNGNLLKKANAESKFCVVATGSRDCSIALWSTQQRRPLFVINNIFSKSVLDMSWASDGQIFMACSWDGTVAFFHFKDGELGTVVSSDEKLTALEGLYGKRLLHGKVEPIVEVPELMAVDEAPKEETPVTPEKEPSPPRLFQAKQIEVRGADGKRRITPITVPRDAPVPNLESFSSSSSTKTKIIVEQRGAEPPKPTEPVEAVEVVEPPPAKQKRVALLRSEVVPTARPIVSAERPRIDNRPKSSPVLRPLGMEAGGSVPILGVPGHFIIIENSKEFPLTRVRRETRRTDGEVIWDMVLGHAVTAARSTAALTVLACVDRTLVILHTASGGPKSLPLLLPGAVACIDLTPRDQLCVVTTCGHVIAWDYKRNCQTLRDNTLRGELQSDAAAFALCRLKEDGYPVVVMTNGRSFAYSPSMGWQLLTDIKTTLWQLSSQKDLLTSLPASDGHLPLRSLIRELKASCAGGLARESGVRSTTATQCSIMLLFLHFHAAAALGSDEEVRGILLALVRVLAQDGGLIQLREILTTYATQRGVLSECLTVLKEYLHCQRLYMELSAGQLTNGDDESLGPPINE